MDVERGKKRKKRPKLPSAEKVKRKKISATKLNRSRVVLGDEFDRWRSLMKDIGVKKDSEMAKCLLDSYIEKTTQKPKLPPPTISSRPVSVSSAKLLSTPSPKPSTSGIATSTPVHSQNIRIQTMLGSEISSVDSGASDSTLTGVEQLGDMEQSDNGAKSTSDPTLTGFEPIGDTDQSENNSNLTRIPTYSLRSRGKALQKKTSDSFLDPFELSIDVSHDEDEASDYSSDSDYEQPFSFTAVLKDEVNKNTDELTLEGLQFGEETEDETDDLETEETEDESVEIGRLEPGIKQIVSVDECEELSEQTTCLTFLTQIRCLAEMPAKKFCSTCQNVVNIQHSFRGSALYLKWTCDKGHVSQRWCSQPVLNRRLHSGDFLSAFSIVCSGNNFGKISLFSKFLNLKFMSQSSFYRIQSSYIVPTVDKFWKVHQEEVLSSFSDKDIVVLGDGRMDSPGHSAQFCTYTMMENVSKKILMLKTLDKRVTDRKSTNMEKVAFQMCMQELRDRGQGVKEVVTDAHLGIGAIMKSQYGHIKHSNDVWHAAKNVGKKILHAGQKRGCGILLLWSRDIVNHFYYCCRQASTYAEFVSMWRGVLHHITNRHSWILSHGEGTNQCSHGPLSEEERNKPWLDPTVDAEALSALAGVVLDKRFLNRIHYLLNFRSTSEIEAFNQLILMYCAKRFSYSPPVYRIRNLLAALDHNMNTDRPVKRSKDGNIVYNRYYNKKSGRWSVFPVKGEKTYAHILKIVCQGLVMRLADNTGMKPRELEIDDPRKISRHLAPMPPPPTQELVKEHVSRFADTDN